jgi:hypothetical protein
MSLKFSVGDFTAVGALIIDITKSLQAVSGAKSDYQELLKELETIQIALRHLDSLEHISPHSSYLDSIKFAALSCRQPLEQFLHKIKKYERSLGYGSKANTVITTTNKLRWAARKQEEVQKLQNYLNLHVTTINMLLAEHGLAVMNIATEKAKSDSVFIRERLDQTRGLLHRVRDSLADQQLVMRNTQSLLSKLFEMVNSEFRTSWKSLGGIVANIW